MVVNSESKNMVLRLWVMLHRVSEIMSLCEDSLFREYGITTEQFRVLSCIKSRGPLRPTDLAQIMERSPNSVSMLVDRMVKAGLVKRAREKKDRRTLRVFLTSEGEKAISLAFPMGWEFIQNLLSPLSDKDKKTLLRLLEIVRTEGLEYVSPEVDTGEIIENSLTRDSGIYKRMVKNFSTLRL